MLCLRYLRMSARTASSLRGVHVANLLTPFSSCTTVNIAVVHLEYDDESRMRDCHHGAGNTFVIESDYVPYKIQLSCFRVLACIMCFVQVIIDARATT
jgi:hypothetical protein